MSDPDRLTVALAGIDEQWSLLGMPVARVAAPGVDRETITNAGASLGLAVPDEVVAWFGWHNGVVQEPRPKSRERILVGRWELTSLEEAVAEYEERRRLAQDEVEPPWSIDDFWPAHFFPLSLATSSDTLAVDCSGPSDEPAAVYVIAWDTGLPATRRGPVAASVTELAELFHQVLCGGWHRYDGDGQRHHFDENGLPEDLRRPLLW